MVIEHLINTKRSKDIHETNIERFDSRLTNFRK